MSSKPRMGVNDFSANSQINCAETFFNGEGKPTIQLWVKMTDKPTTQQPIAYISRSELIEMIKKLDELSAVEIREVVDE